MPIKYVILIWNEYDLSDIRVLQSAETNKARVFDDSELAHMHAVTRTRTRFVRVVEVPYNDPT